ncbi:MAG TPA: coproporphyrinogen III oxidase family protein, partial [Candidatus Edwardsbacteria bacterium]|nr:coproporphyrinogen III oxidase family protein [Candidatus Edwardsbacteria bacterium]
DYRGCGAGAHSHRSGRRWGNEADPAAYVRLVQTGARPVAFEETLSREQRLFEAVFLGLRLVAGIDTAAFQRQWGCSPLDYQPAVWDRLRRQGMVETRPGSVSLTQRGLLLADRVLAELAPEYDQRCDSEQ